MPSDQIVEILRGRREGSLGYLVINVFQTIVVKSYVAMFHGNYTN
jgi:hypothetical protein